MAKTILISGKEEINLIWEDMKQNRKVLGMDVTKAYYQNKLKTPDIFNTTFVNEKLSALDNGTGQTYFDIILEIISEHPNIKLISK